jgi:Helix-turn-helix domain of resolvase
MGRKPKLTELQWRAAREQVAKGESARAIALEWGVAHTTVARAVALDLYIDRCLACRGRPAGSYFRPRCKGTEQAGRAARRVESVGACHWHGRC